MGKVIQIKLGNKGKDRMKRTLILAAVFSVAMFAGEQAFAYDGTKRGEGVGDSKGKACNRAQEHAEGMAAYHGRVVDVSRCSCYKDDVMYTCTAKAYYRDE